MVVADFRNNPRGELGTRTSTLHAEGVKKLRLNWVYKKALGDGAQSVAAAIFWLKTRAGWKETSVHELPEPVKVAISWEDSKLL